jgi:hypothetical protein
MGDEEGVWMVEMTPRDFWFGVLVEIRVEWMVEGFIQVVGEICSRRIMNKS